MQRWLVGSSVAIMNVAVKYTYTPSIHGATCVSAYDLACVRAMRKQVRKQKQQQMRISGSVTLG